MELEEFQPDTGSFKLSLVNETFHLRRFTLADEIWLKKKYGNDSNLREIIKDAARDFSKIAEIAYHQIKEDQKYHFIKQSVKFVDDEGESKQIEIGGANLLFQMIAGELEKRDIMYAVVQTFGVSRQALEAAEQGEKKKMGLLNEQTGQESLTSSQANTDGRSNTSSP